MKLLTFIFIQIYRNINEICHPIPTISISALFRIDSTIDRLEVYCWKFYYLCMLVKHKWKSTFTTATWTPNRTVASTVVPSTIVTDLIAIFSDPLVNAPNTGLTQSLSGSTTARGWTPGLTIDVLPYWALL